MCQIKISLRASAEQPACNPHAHIRFKTSQTHPCPTPLPCVRNRERPHVYKKGREYLSRPRGYEYGGGGSSEEESCVQAQSQSQPQSQPQPQSQSQSQPGHDKHDGLDHVLGSFRPARMVVDAHGAPSMRFPSAVISPGANYHARIRAR